MTRSTFSALLGAALLWPCTPLFVTANAQRPNIAPAPNTASLPRAIATITPPPHRAVLGVALRTGSRADTLGLEIGEVMPNGPAHKAGLVQGMRLDAINGVSLRVSADDAADPMTADAGYRRLQRILASLEAGEVVELRVRDGQGQRTVSLTTVSNASLAQSQALDITSRLRAASERIPRAALGMAVISSGNARDTLGLFITAVSATGPADSAGVIEGERIAAINGVDVRVPHEDIADARAGFARVNRLGRAIAALAPGDVVTLRVFGHGRFREVRLAAGQAATVGTPALTLRVPGLGAAR